MPMEVKGWMDSVKFLMHVSEVQRSLRFRVQGLGFIRFRVQSLDFRGLEVRVEGLEFRVV